MWLRNYAFKLDVFLSLVARPRNRLLLCGFTINIVLCLPAHYTPLVVGFYLSNLNYAFKHFYHAHVAHNTLLVCDRKPQQIIYPENRWNYFAAIVMAWNSPKITFKLLINFVEGTQCAGRRGKSSVSPRFSFNATDVWYQLNNYINFWRTRRCLQVHRHDTASETMTRHETAPSIQFNFSLRFSACFSAANMTFSLEATEN